MPRDPSAGRTDPASPPAQPRPTVLYITGYGRSGSTVMDMLLQRRPDVFGGGELTHVFAWMGGRRCACGVPLSECGFWRAVSARVAAEAGEVSAAEAVDVTRRVERRPLWLPGFGPDRSTLVRYRQIWTALINAVAHESGSTLVVDSSKTSFGTMGRPFALARFCGFDVRLLHLVRDPRAVAWSQLRGSNQDLEAGSSRPRRGGAVRTTVGWTFANLVAELLARRLPCSRVRYESFVQAPQRELDRVSDDLSLDLRCEPAGAGDLVELAPGHGVAGNRIRRTPVLHLQMDDEWRSRLPPWTRRSMMLAWPLAARYGYSAREW